MPEVRSETNELQTPSQRHEKASAEELARQITQDRRPKVKMVAPIGVNVVMGKKVPENRVVSVPDNVAKMLSNRGFVMVTPEQAAGLEKGPGPQEERRKRGRG